MSCCVRMIWQVYFINNRGLDSSSISMHCDVEGLVIREIGLVHFARCSCLSIQMVYGSVVVGGCTKLLFFQGRRFRAQVEMTRCRAGNGVG